MKAIIVGPAYPLRGGIASFNESLCRTMVRRGIQTEIISFSLQYPSFLFPGKTQYDEGPGPDDLHITTMLNSINPFSWRKVALAIKDRQPDVVIIRYWIPFMAPCLAYIARSARKFAKVIAIADNIIPHEKRIGDTLLTKHFVKAIDGFVVMSGSVVDELKSFTAKPTSYLPHPIYDVYGEKVTKKEAMERLGLKFDNKHLLFFGFIRKYKGLDLLLEAMGDHRIKTLNIKLLVAGEFYDDQDYYNELILKYGLSNNVILKAGYIPAADVRYYFCAADMIVQPYRSATQSGITQIAYNFERPMLVTNTGGLPEIVPDKKVGYVVKPFSDDIANAIIDFYQNEREEAFSLQTRTEKMRFTWDYFVQGLEKLALTL